MGPVCDRWHSSSDNLNGERESLEEVDEGVRREAYYIDHFTN
jgi:hypothetical protein